MSDTSDTTVTSPDPQGRPRRRRRGARGASRGTTPKSNAQSGEEGARRQRSRGRRRGERGAPRAAPSAAVAALRGVPKLEDKPVEAPLTEAERTVLREHFAFLRKHRRNLRLKLNAQEDLLLNGVREPEHRGVCQHLLQKVDHSAVQGALARMVSPEQKLELLTGAVKISSELPILILYLEALAVAESRAEAAAALSVGLRQIDFSTASAAQMRRILELLVELFPREERPALVFGLLQSPTFREAFDASQEKMPEALAELLVPLRAVHAVVLKGQPNPADAAALEAGVAMLLEGGPGSVRAYPEPVRKRLLQRGLASLEKSRMSLKPLTALLESFPARSREFSRYGMRLAGALLAHHHDDAARKWLERVADAHPDFRLPRRWLTELDKPRVERVAVDDVPQQQDPRALLPGWSIDTQRSVWLRLGPADALEREAALHREVLLPSVAPVLEQRAGVVVVAHLGRPFSERASRRDVANEQRLGWAWDGASLLWTLAQLGLQLPDAQADRFLVDAGARLWLANLGGVVRADATEAQALHLEHAKAWVSEVLQGGKGAALAELREAVGAARDWLALQRTLTGAM